MNARPNLSIGWTASPTADAERYENARDAYEEWREIAARQAPLIVLKQLQDPSPGHWFKYHICAGAMFSPDEIAAMAVEEDDDSRDALAELMASPAALKFKQKAAEWFARERAVDIYTNHMESQQ